MTGRKKAARRGGLQGGGRGARNGTAGNTSFVPFASTAIPSGGHKGFTLAEEARNTERHHSWNTDQRLRHSQVKFVSAGKLESMDSEDAESAMAEMTLDSPPQGEDNLIVVEEEEEEETYVRDEVMMDSTDELERPNTSGQDTNIPSFIVDTKGTQPVHTGFAPPRLRSVSPPRAASPTPSDSSTEVILFTGRNLGRNAVSTELEAVRSKDKLSIITTIEDDSYKQPSSKIDAQIRDVESKIQERQEFLGEAVHHEPAFTKHKGKGPVKKQAMNTSNLSTSSNKPPRRNKISSEDDDAWIADYIANMDKDEDSTFETYNQRELGGLDDGIWQETEASSDAIQTRGERGWSREDIDDFDDLSTSDGERGEVQEILSKRERVSGVQYLVVWKDHEVDEARWVPFTTLISKTALSHIETFEAEERLVAELDDNGEDDTSDSEDLDIHGSTDGLEQPLTDLRPMSDAKIARLLAKQEELGMGSDEIVLFDDQEDDEEQVPSRFVMASSKKHTNARGSKRPRGEYPSATMMADAFDGFDVMDFDRPSLRRNPKGRRGKLTLDLSDSELEAAMAWENDRHNKSAKKKEREELRNQGLLGSKNGKPDLKQKYKEGMGIHAVKEEIKTFLMGSNSSLSLPPMDKADRKVVHELANTFNLKSKSAGNGLKRFPILYRTTRTTRFVERQFDAAEARISRKYLPRMDVGGKGRSSARGGGGSNAAVSYRDGDVVGGSAPELGADNKGRAMLEKMGWSTGTALGASNNKGILQPVSHVVKTTKAGLG